MIRLLLSSVTALAIAAAFAWWLGGVAGTGVLLGALLGVGFAALGILYVRHTLIHRPALALHAFAVAFLAKLVVLLIGALALRYVEAAAEHADYRTFLFGFAAAVALLLPIGTIDVVSALRRDRDAVAGAHRLPVEN